MTLADAQARKVHRFTREEFLRMADAGLFQDQRAELIEGEIIDMAPQRNPHALAVTILLRELMKTYPNDWVRCQMPLSLGPRNEPEPDLAVCPGAPETYQGRVDNPSEAMLVVEVSESTLAFDRQTKQRVYARANVAEYWIVNLVEKTLEVYRQPDPRAERYTAQQVLHATDAVTPLSCSAAISLDRLLA